MVPSIGNNFDSTIVTITGTNLGSGSDITAVYLVGVEATIGGQTATAVVVGTALGNAGTGDVEVRSTSMGVTRLVAGFTYYLRTRKLLYRLI